MTAAREGDGRRLLDLVERAERGDAQPESEPAEVERDALPVAIRLLDAPPPQPLEWISDGLLLKDINMLAGQGEAGKSTAALAMLGALADGSKVFGRFSTGRPRTVLLVSEEDGLDVIQNRLAALIAGHGWDRERVLSNIHLHALDGVRLDDTPWQLHLAREAAALGADLVAFDPAAALMSRSALSNDDVKVVTGFCRALLKAGHAVLVLVHVTKPSEQRTEKQHRVLGAVEWFNAARMVWWVEGSVQGPTLECIKSSRTRRPDPLLVVRRVETDPTNEAIWLEATMTLRADTLTADALSDHDLAVLGVLCKAVNAPSSTDVRLLVRRQGVKANNEEVAASIAGLMAANLIHWDRVGKAKAWSPTDEGRAAYARARGERENAD